MTRPASSKLNKHAKTCSLVLDGNTVKARLQAERIETNSVVHVDWVRFTILRRNAPTPSVDDLFPPAEPATKDATNTNASPSAITWAPSVFDDRWQQLRKQLLEMPDPDYSASIQAKDLALLVAEALGPDFELHPEIRKGHDFYRFRWSILRNAEEVAWVGYGASGDSPRQSAQAKTIHANIYGSATTFAQHGWNQRIAAICDDTQATLTRCDLALDFFDGITGGMNRIKDDYTNGLCDSGGKRLKCNMVGDWANGKARSFYFGSKEAGKQTNVYEKGHQIVGDKDPSPWMRAELRYGNKLRFLPIEILRRPQDHFAGASDWHAALLREHGKDQVTPEPIPCEPKLAAQTIEAEVTRNKRWVKDVAGPSLALLFSFMDATEFAAIVEGAKLPGRLARFTRNEIARVYSAATERINKGASAGHAYA